MDTGTEGRRALVGGGASGMVAASPRRSRRRAQVALIGRTADRVTDAAATLGRIQVVADLATTDGPAAAVDEAVAGLGDNLLVVNTGSPPGSTFDTLDEEAWNVAIDGTLRSVLRLRGPAAPAGRNRSGGPDRALVVGPRARSRRSRPPTCCDRGSPAS